MTREEIEAIKFKATDMTKHVKDQDARERQRKELAAFLRELEQIKQLTADQPQENNYE